MSDLAPGKLEEAETVPLDKFLSRENKSTSEHMHVRFDEDDRQLAFYRSLGGARDSEWIRTDMSGRIALMNADQRPSGFFITATDAETVLTWLDRLRVEQSPTTVTIDYWAKNNSQMIDSSDFDNESIFFAYATESGRSNKVKIDGLYKNSVQMMASH